MNHIIQLNNIVKNYQVGVQEVKALQSVSLGIQQNEFVVIMGPSGSGKSTLMNIIGCLDTPTSGDYLLNGQKVCEMDNEQLARVRNREIGFIFQTFNLLPKYSAIENVMLPLVYAGIPKQERIARAKEAMEKVNLSDRSLHKPNELSGGQKQRVAIARALANSPSIILADEPTGNLDSKTSKDIMALLGKIHQNGNTIILVTHEESIATRVQRVIRLKDGQVGSDEKNS